MHVSAEKSEYFKQLKTAEDNAKQRKLRIWENYEEKSEDQIVEEEHVVGSLFTNNCRKKLIVYIYIHIYRNLIRKLWKK